MKTSNLTVSEGSHINNLTIPSGNTFPTNGNTGELFYLTTGAVGVYCHNGSQWNLLSVVSSKIQRQTVSTTNGNWAITLTGVSQVLDVNVVVRPTTTFSPRFNTFRDISTTSITGTIYEVMGLGGLMVTDDVVQVTVTVTYN